MLKDVSEQTFPSHILPAALPLANDDGKRRKIVPLYQVIWNIHATR